MLEDYVRTGEMEKEKKEPKLEKRSWTLCRRQRPPRRDPASEPAKHHPEIQAFIILPITNCLSVSSISPFRNFDYQPLPLQ